MPTLTTVFLPFCLIALPWLNPFSFGPTPAVMPLLFSWACALALMGSYGLGVMGTDGERLVRVTRAAWLAAASLSAVLGLLQYFGVSARFEPWVNSTGLGEAFGNLRQRNQFATLTNIGLVALLAWTVQAPGPATPVAKGAPTWPLARRWVFALLAAGLLGLGNAASSSRTGLVQLGMLVLLAGVWRSWRRPQARGVLLAAALAYAVGALVLPRLAGLDPLSAGILARLHEGDSACGSRLTLWGNVWHLTTLKPWLGWGWGELSYAHFITLYPGNGPRFCELLGNAHNLPLHLAVELGLPVALAFCSAFALALWCAKPWRESNASRQMAWAVIAVILMHSLLEYPLWYGPFQMAFGLSVWMLLRTPARQGESSKPFSPLAPYLRAWVAMLLIAFVAYAAWDYQRISQIYLPPPERQAAYRENTLTKISATWLFRHQVNFAGLSTAELSASNAAPLHDLALDLLHYSPEARVVERVIESAELLGLKDEAAYYRARFQAAYPERYAQWLTEKKP